MDLKDMLIFKDDLLDTPVVIKKEYSDTETIDEIATKCSESGEIASIKCEEIYIKHELDNGAEQSGSYEFDNDDSLPADSSSKGKRIVRKVCPKCPFSTKYNHRLKTHMHTHSDSKQHSCTVCSFVTDARLLLKAHMAIHKGATKKYSCSKCSYETNRKDNLKRHFIKHKDISEVEMHKCLLCHIQFKHKSSLVKHRKLHHNNAVKMYKCRKCSFRTNYRRYLVTHHLLHEGPKVVNEFKCENIPHQVAGSPQDT